MADNSLKLSWSMTLTDYREYFRNNEQYRKFCGACYQWSKSDPTSQAGYIHLAFSILLLENLSTTSEIWTLYSKDVMESKNATGKVNTGAISQGITGIFDSSKESYALWCEWLTNKLNLSKTILEAYELIKTGLSKDKQNFKNPQKISAALETVLDKLLTPTDTDIITDRIQNGGCRQIILTGAPGTGKTTIARMIAESLGSSLDGEKYTLVQFHPSYDYTDFVEGLRPVAQSDQKESKIQFAKMDGSFKAFCRKVVESNQNNTDSTALPVTPVNQILRDTEQHLEALSAYIKAFLNLSKCFDVLDANDIKSNEKSEKFAKEFNNVYVALPKDTSVFPEGPLKTAADTLLRCATILDKIVKTPMNPRNNNNNYMPVLVEMATLIRPEIKKAVTNKVEHEIEIDSGTASTIYDACIQLRAALHKERRGALIDTFESNAFKTIRDYISTDANTTIFQNIYDTNRSESGKAKKINDDANRISELLIAIETAYPVSSKVRDALGFLVEQNDKITKELSAATDALKSMSRKPEPVSTKSPLYFFIIDEINRANLSKVFGELMYGLEKDKRDTGFQTQYHNLPTCDNTGEKMPNDIFDPNFYIPGNVMIIGTMNDIDRSVDSMDYALRRRFEWKEIVVNERTLSAAFTSGEYIQAVQNNQSNLVRCIMALNHYIQDKGDPYNLNRQYFISQGQFAHLPENLTALDNLNVFDAKGETNEESETNEDGKTNEDGENNEEDETNESPEAIRNAELELNNLKKVLSYAWKYRIEPLLREYLRGESEKDIQKFVDGAHGKLKDTLKAIKSDMPNPKKSKSKGTTK